MNGSTALIWAYVIGACLLWGYAAWIYIKGRQVAQRERERRAS